MAADEYHHGARVLELNDGTRPIQTINTSIIGMVCTSSDADKTLFPADKPVLLTDVQGKLGKAGNKGTLAPALQAIADQGNPAVVVVRVDEATAASGTTTEANIIGKVTSDGQRTGLKALLSAEAELNVKPRILGVPGLDTQAVTNELVITAQKLRGFAYARAVASTKEDAVKYRGNFGQRELMLLWPEMTRQDAVAKKPGDASTVARALGLRAKIDNDTGWHKTLSNVPVNGVDGLSASVYWDLQQTGTDADYLNENCVTTMIRKNGFRFWGSRTCSSDPLFPYENYTRTAQVLADTIADAHMWAVDGTLNPQLAKDIVEGVRAKFRQLKTLGYLIDGDCWYDDSVNTADTLKSGKLLIDYDYTPVPPLENLLFRQRITDRYLVNFGQQLAA
ncbi:phage tail sheath protein [Salmonella enterica]|nr:phage tail sheath protein [Salmonella enterica]EBL5124029.1 phage tail sheath protein [Salmonella enterica subsp. enterica serovar Rubislaw]EDA0234358.1 phage tail sheath protein [Salmonella enterica]EFR3657095.1 phage tail sheath protein [Salmonella enterica]EGI2036749.1 phage tail sheath protein [Salmonella enterica]